MTPLAERFWAKVERTESCWLWTGVIHCTGYGRLNHNCRPMFAHRASYMLNVGPIPHGLTIDHLCRVRRCVNPSHMELVTRGENTLRGYAPAAINARKTHCIRGHLFDAINTRTTPQRRACRVCERVRDRRRRESARRNELYS